MTSAPLSDAELVARLREPVTIHLPQTRVAAEDAKIIRQLLIERAEAADRIESAATREAEAVRREREECAKIADHHEANAARGRTEWDTGAGLTACLIAAAIRSRGAETP